ncbi:MAG: hypothetical protein V4632_04335 [Pseudomonadota bacterium]
MNEWNLNASSGRENVHGCLVGQFNSAGRQLLRLEITITGSFWRRDTPIGVAETVNDFSVKLPQVISRKDNIDFLILELSDWLKNPKEVSVDLASNCNNDQSFRLSLGVRDDLISSVDRPACTINYTGTAFKYGEWCFVIDQSCVRNWYDELKSFDIS